MSFALSVKLSDVRLCQDLEQKISREPREISLVISLLIDGKDIAGLEPPVFGEHLRSGLFIIEVTSRDTASLDPKFTRFSDAAIHTILTNDPGLQAGHKKTN